MFKNLDFFSYPIHKGFYSLGLIHHHRPEINLIEANLTGLDTYDQWQKLLDTEIKSDMINALLVNEEDFLNICTTDDRIPDLINSFYNSKVYLISQMDPFSRKIYTNQVLIKLPIVELPWWLVNEILTYHFSKDFFTNEINELSSNNFVCTIGRSDVHKNELAKQLIYRFDNIGHIFFQTVPKEIKNIGQKSPFTCYTGRSNYLTDRFSTNSMKKNCIKLHNFKISLNTENIAGFKKFLKKIPMVIHPESTMGTFLTTEKTTWPIQLGKLLLIAAKPYHYQDLQRFVETNHEEIFNLEFDQIQAYTNKQQQEKINFMLDSNSYQIKHAFQLYETHIHSLEADKLNLAKNYYEFFIQQLDKIV